MLPKFNSFEKFIAFIATIYLIALGVIPFIQVGWNKMIFGEQVANQVVYPIVGQVIQWTAVIALLTLIGLVIAGFINYLKNRGKTEEPTLLDILSELRALRQDMKAGACKYVASGSDKPKPIESSKQSNL